MEVVMTNIEMEVKDNILIIKIDLDKRFEPSKSGKTISVASTSGNIAVPEHKDIKIGLNAYVKNPAYKGE
jgi:hypothetical protein